MLRLGRLVYEAHFAHELLTLLPGLGLLPSLEQLRGAREGMTDCGREQGRVAVGAGYSCMSQQCSKPCSNSRGDTGEGARCTLLAGIVRGRTHVALHEGLTLPWSYGNDTCRMPAPHAQIDACDRKVLYVILQFA